MHHNKIDIARVPHRYYLSAIAAFMVIIFAFVFIKSSTGMHYLVLESTKKSVLMDVVNKSHGQVENMNLKDGVFEIAFKAAISRQEKSDIMDAINKEGIKIKSFTQIESRNTPIFSLGIFVIAMIFTIILVTRTFMLTHFDDIHTLELMGARRRYIVRQFQNQFFKVYAFGAFLGFVAIAVLFFITHSHMLSLTFIAQNILKPDVLMMLVLCPFVVVLFAMMLSMLTILTHIYKKR